jgi:cytochrome c5
MQGRMKLHLSFRPVILLVAAGMLSACSKQPTPAAPAGAGGFSKAKTVIEQSCVHCHGEHRLATMPAFGDTAALAALRGPGKWIVPGNPEASRFLQVVTLSDSQPGAMPPTGHAISAKDIAVLRAWITAGAPLPAGAPVVLKPHGIGPRSL